ncbi:MAG: hypothetical protein Fur0021_32330 [Candidatus Promineifilaceae bacterium]
MEKLKAQLERLVSEPGEGQLHLRHDNINEFSQYEVKGRDLLEAIRNAYWRQHGR